jgi:hypothetical protein
MTFRNKLCVFRAAACALAVGVVLASPLAVRAAAQLSASAYVPLAARLPRLQLPPDTETVAGTPQPAKRSSAAPTPRPATGVHGVRRPLRRVRKPSSNAPGSVVAPNIVLTAGPCAVDKTTGETLDRSGFVVLTGSIDWTDTTQRQVSSVSQVIVNHGYLAEPPDTTDASLLVLSGATSALAIPSR